MKTQKAIMLKIGGGQGVQECSKSATANFVLTSDNKLLPFDLNDVVDISSFPNSTTTINELGRRLLKATSDGDIDEMKNLLSKGAPFTADWLGTSPLHMAAQKNYLDVCNLLLKAGISKDARTKVDRTPMHIAAYEGHLDVVMALCDVGADLNAKDLLGMTPLHWAVQNGHYRVVEYLVQSGAVTNETNKFDLTPLDIADQINRLDIVKFLNSFAADSVAATENLVLQLENDKSNGENVVNNENDEDMEHMSIAVEPIIISDDNEIVTEEDIQEIDVDDDSPTLTINKLNNNNKKIIQNLSDNEAKALKFLQEHGITMLPNDDECNILSSVMENGHSVVLTDVGKEVLNTFKKSDDPLPRMKNKIIEKRKIVTLSPEEYLAMTNSNNSNLGNKIQKLKVLPVKPNVKRIVMKKNRVVPVSNNVQIKDAKTQSSTDMELVMKQLIEAQQTIEEYKIKLQQKEKEAERYKLQLKLLMNSN